MAEQKKEAGKKALWSTIYLLVAICLFLGVCANYYPQVGQTLRDVISGPDDSPIREAFGVLTDGLSDSRPVKEVLSQSYEVLSGEDA